MIWLLVTGLIVIVVVLFFAVAGELDHLREQHRHTSPPLDLERRELEEAAARRARLNTQVRPK